METRPRVTLRKKCWELGAFTSSTVSDHGITHYISNKSDSTEALQTSNSDPGHITFFDTTAWLDICYYNRDFIDESKYMKSFSEFPVAVNRVHRNAPAITHLRSDPEPFAHSLQKKERSRIAYRRSDVSSVPLRPDGVFRGLLLSIYGWSDHRLESSLVHQITTNGGVIVPINSEKHFACICSDGSNPINSNGDLKLVSQRWLNECLASGQVLEPSSKTIFSPSTSQLPLLITKKVCLYISEKDESKLNEICDVAKVCGIKYVTRNDTRIPLSTVTHFIFYDNASANRRRDLFPLASKSNKFVVSFAWLEQTFRFGSLQNEADYDLSYLLKQPALLDCNAQDLPPLQNTVVVGSNEHEHLRGLVIELGASYVKYSNEVSNHTCSDKFFLFPRPQTCSCPFIDELWLQECARQKRMVPIGQSPLTVPEGVKLSNLSENDADVHWENTKMSSLKNYIHHS